MSELLLRLPGAAVPERAHARDHVILWQLRGSTTLRLGDGNTTELSEGEAAWLPCGTRHTLQVQDDSIVTPLFISAVTQRSTLTTFTVVRIEPEEQFLLFALWNAQSTIIQRAADLQHQVVAVMERAAHRTDLPMPSTPEAAAVARALVRSPGDDRRIADWAEEACMSGRSLERAFTAETGLSFGQWRKTCRMLTAARLLTSGHTVQSVSARVGYENPGSFARAFREFHGTRPKDYTAH